MRLAFALFDYFPFGGLQRDMLAIARACVAAGHDVTVFTRHWEGERVEGIDVELLPISAGSNHRRDRLFAAAFVQHSSGFDRRVGFNKMPGLDLYYAADGCLAAQYQGKPLAWLRRYRDRLAMEAAVFSDQADTRILSISPPQRQLFQRFYQTPSRRFVDLPPGIRRDRIVPDDYSHRRAAKRRALNVDEAQTLALFVGSGFRTKGLDRALHAFAEGCSADALFFVVGADKPGRFQRLARRLGVASRVHFMGGQNDIPEWLWAADVLLHPAYAENTGTVLLEAAVAGTPVITTSACGYAPYLVDANMGVVIDADAVSTASLVAGLNQVLAVDRDDWLKRAQAFAASADIFSLVDHAVSVITEAGE